MCVCVCDGCMTGTQFRRIEERERERERKREGTLNENIKDEEEKETREK